MLYPKAERAREGGSEQGEPERGRASRAWPGLVLRLLSAQHLELSTEQTGFEFLKMVELDFLVINIIINVNIEIKININTSSVTVYLNFSMYLPGQRASSKNALGLSPISCLNRFRSKDRIHGCDLFSS